MKTLHYYLILLLSSVAVMLISCDSFLDIAEDQEMTFEKVWLKRNTIERYLNNVWGYMPNISDPLQTTPFFGATDEASISLTHHGFNSINKGIWNPSSVPYDRFATYYQGIREANIFMQEIPRVDLPDVSEEEKLSWYYEARFARAYYYYLLFQLWGPIMLTGDEPIDFTQSVEDLYQQRNSHTECIEYIVSEMEICSRELPTRQTTNFYGKPTKGACYAVIAELRLYTARKLYNGNSLYKDVKNPDGSEIFPGIETADPTKWKLAADAAKRIIDMGIYELCKTYNEDGTLNPYKSYQSIYLNLWNDELIFARYLNGQDMRRHINPRVTAGGGAWGVYGPTQDMVDAYAMDNGKYPITGYDTNHNPIIDPTAGYVEDGFTDYAHPLDQPTSGNTLIMSTYNMYTNREPRFYASVLWSNTNLPYLLANKVVNLAFNGNSGPGLSQNAPICGYLVRKYYHPNLNNNAQEWGVFTFPIFRYAEMILNYIEALNEIEPTNADIVTYLNIIRERAGVPPIEQVYPDAVRNQEKMRDLIRKERRVEMAFEAKRYMDTRTWMISKEVDSGDMWGMNASSSAPSSHVDVTPPEFWQRTVFETRVFRDQDYLFPFSQEELKRNKKITQNYGW